MLAGAERVWCGDRFILAAHIQPDTDAEGEPKQTQHFSEPETHLNQYGHLAFCRFPTPDLPRTSGVYGLTVDDELVYVGESQDLRKRWDGSGYARIARYNCYRKTKDTSQGQSTNCRINNCILRAAQARRAIHLWVHETDHPRPVERLLIRCLEPPWNRRP